MIHKTTAEQEAVDSFLSPNFPNDFLPGPISEQERSVIDTILTGVQTQFNPLTYVLGLAIDFTMLAQRLSHHYPDAKEFCGDLTETKLFDRYELVTKRGKKQVNTLSFKFKNKTFGIRVIEEAVCDLFVKADRTGYPSAYVYNTGMWHHYKELLLGCFKLSEAGRYILITALIDLGLELFPKNTYFGRVAPRTRLFEEIVKHYPRSGPDENAGMAFQGIAYGYLNADRPHLSLIVDKVRTGSARQRRFGDIDGYYGLDLEVSVEVKDHAITCSNVGSELGQFLRDVANHRVQGLAFVRSIDDASRGILAASGVTAYTEDELLRSIERWDWRKQDAAVNGFLHFIAHVEQNPKAVKRLLGFVMDRDPGHDSLAYYPKDSE